MAVVIVFAGTVLVDWFKDKPPPKAVAPLSVEASSASGFKILGFRTAQFGMKEEDLRDIVIFSDDAASWYMTQYGIQSDLAITLIDRTGRPVESCSVPAEIARCLASFDKIIIAESTGRVRAPAVRPGE